MKQYLYEASQDGSESWRFYPTDKYGWKTLKVIAYFGSFVKDKRYFCSPTDNPDKIEVSGFFKMTFVYQKLNKKNKMVDVHQKAKYIGYFTLFFDKSDCQKYLEFVMAK